MGTNVLKHHLKAAFALIAAILVTIGVAFGVVAKPAQADTTTVVDDEVKRGQLIIMKKDAQTSRGDVSQGGGDLAGAKFTITNKSAAAVVYIENGHKLTKNPNESWDIEVKQYTDNNGTITGTAGATYYAAQTDSNALPFGSYHVQEKSGSNGYGIVNKDNALTIDYIPGLLKEDGNYEWIDTRNTNYDWSQRGYDFTVNTEGQITVFDSDITYGDTGNVAKSQAEGNWTTTAKSGTPAYNALIKYAGPACFNVPIRGEIHVEKIDHDYGNKTPQGNASFDGAEFQIYNVNAHAVTVWGHFDENLGHGAPLFDDANHDGWYEPGEVVATISAGDSSTAMTLQDALPVGYYKIVETKAPNGYGIETTNVRYVSITDDNFQSGPITKIDDPVLRGGVAFQKVDADLQEAYAQGDASLAPAEITVYNESERSVVIYEQDNDIRHIKGVVKPGEIVGVIQTNENGYAQLLQLPYGSYRAVETDPSTGYRINSDWEVNFDITGASQTEIGSTPTITNDTQGKFVEVTCDVLEEQVQRGNIHGAKVDADTHGHVALGGASLAGAKISVTNQSKHDVVVYMDANGNAFEKDEDGNYTSEARRIATGEVVATLTTDENGYYDINELPYGTYKLVETKAPTGYMINKDWSQTIQIRKDGKTYDVSEYIDEKDQAAAAKEGRFSALTDQVIREDITFTKIDENNQPLEGVAFRLTSKTTGESHILVTDKNGTINTAAWLAADPTDEMGQPQWRMHTYNTNASDAADNGSGTIKDSSLLNYDQGYWFYGFDDKDEANAEFLENATIYDVRSALPWDTYTLEELRCDANVGKDLVKRDITLDRSNNVLENLGTITNNNYQDDPCCIAVSPNSTGSKVEMTSPQEGTQVNEGDTINYIINYENTTGDTIGSVHIRSYIPAGTEYVDGSATHDGVYVSADDSENGRAYVEWVTDSYDPINKDEFKYDVRVVSGAPSIIKSQVLFEDMDEKVADAGDPSLVDPTNASNVVRISTDGTKTGSNLYAEKSVEPASGTHVTTGDAVKYSVKIINKGDTAQNNVAIQDSLPQGFIVNQSEDSEGFTVYEISDNGKYNGGTITWQIGTLQPGESKTVTVAGTVGADASHIFDNQATYGVFAGGAYCDLPSTTNVAGLIVDKLPELSVEKFADVDYTVPSDIVTYTIKVTNNGEGNARNVPVFDFIPENTRYVSGSVTTEFSGQAATDETPYVSWMIPQIDRKGGSVELTYQVRINDDVAGKTVSNYVQVGGTEPLPAGSTEPTNSVDEPTFSEPNVLEVINPLDANPDGGNAVEIYKSADPADGSYVNAGDKITYTIDWNNVSDHNVNGFAIRDAIPEGTTFVPGSIVVTGADGKTSTEIREAASDTNAKPGVNEGVVPTPEPSSTTVWTEVGTFKVVDAESVYDACVWDRATQSIENWDEIRAWLETAEPGQDIEFTVTNSAWYNTLWHAIIDSDGGVKLLCRILVPSAAESQNYVVANGVTGNYDQRDNAVYVLVDQLKPGQTGKVTFEVTVNDDVDFNTNITNDYTYGAGIYGAPSGDLNNKGQNNTTHVVGEPQLDATKTVSPEGYFNPDTDVLTYTIDIANNGSATARNVAIYDELPDNVTYVAHSYSVSGSDSAEYGKTYSKDIAYNAPVIRAKASTLAPGETLSVTFKVRVVDAKVGDVVANHAYWDSNVDDNDFDSLKNEVSSEDVVAELPQLGIKVDSTPADGSSVAAGDAINYTITVNNDANVDARGVSVTNSIPSYTELVSAEDGLKTIDGDSAVNIKDETVPAKGSKTYHFTVKVSEYAPAHTMISNTAYAGIVSAQEVTSNTIQHQVLAPQVKLTKTSDPETGTYVSEGDIITYTIVAKNEGTFTARGIGIYDAIPTATEYVKGSLKVAGATVGEDYVSGFVGDLAPGEEATMTFQVRVLGLEYGSIANTASWTYNVGKAPDKPSDNISNTIGLNYGTTDVIVTKTQDPAHTSEVTGNDEITYTVDLTNASQIVADGVGVFEEIPEGTTYVAGSLSGNGVDTSEIKDDDGNVVAVAAYTEHLGTGKSASLIYKVKVNVGFSGHIPSHATWDFNQASMPSDKLLRMSNDVFAVAKQPASLELVASVDPASGTPVAAGDVLTYSVEAKNTGDVDITGVNISDMIPTGLDYVDDSATGGWSYVDGKLVANNQTIPANGSMTYTFQARVDKKAVDGSVFANTVHAVTSSQPNVVSNTVTNSVVEPDINLVQVSTPADGSEISAGDTITYTIKAINNGTLTARGVGIYDAIPAGTTYVDDSLVVSGANVGDGYVAGYVGNIAPGDEAEMTFKVTVNDNANGGISNVASWDYLLDAAPTKATANTSNKTTLTTEHADVEVTTTQNPADGALVAPLDTVTYTVRAVNMGHANARGVAIFDAIPEGTTYVANSMKVTGGTGNTVKAISDSDDTTSAGVVDSADAAASANASATVQAVTAYAQLLEPGDSMTLTFKVKVNQGVFNTVINQPTWNTGLSAAPDNALPRLSNDVDFRSEHASMSIKKTQNPPTGSYLTGGDTLTYTVEVQNTGKVTAHNVGIYDIAPDNTQYVEGSLSGDGQTYIGEDGLLTVIAGDMAPGEKATMTFQAEIDLDFVGTIHNRALWVSPAADPVIVPDSGSAEDDTEVSDAPKGILSTIMSWFSAPVVQQNAALNVPIPDGADSGWSNDTGDPDDNGDNNGNTNEGGDVNGDDNGGNTTNPETPGTTTPSEDDNNNDSGNTNTPGDDNQGGTTGGNSGTTTHPVTPPTEGDDSNTGLEVPGDNNGSSSNETVVHVVKPTLEITKTSNPADGSYVKAGDEVTYTINASNVGTVNANKLVLVDEVPAGIDFDASSVKADGLDVEVDGSTITATGSIASGKSATITFSGTVADDAEGAIANSIKWAQSNDGQLPEDESKISVSNDATLNAVDPTLEVLKSASVVDGAFVAPGQEVTYTLLVTNKGEVAITPVLTDVLDENLRLVDGSVMGVDDSDFNAANNTLTMNLPELAPGQSQTITFKADISNKVEAGSVINNTVNWEDTGTTGNSGTSNNFDMIVGSPVITATKSVVADTEGAGTDEFAAKADVSKDDVAAAAAVYVPGDVVNYQFVLNNTGNIGADVVATDTLPEGVELVEGSLSDNASYDSASRTITFDGDVNMGESVTVTYAVTVLAGFEGQSVVNTLDAVVNGVEKPSIAGATIEVGAPVTTLTKAVDAAEVESGSTITYTLTATNSGNAADKDIVITDAIPDGTTYVEGSAEGAEFVDGKLVWSIDTLSVDESKDVTFKVSVNDIAVPEDYAVGDELPSVNIANTATYTTSYSEGTSNTVETVATATPVGVSNLVLSKTVSQINGKDVKDSDAHDVVAGDKVTYTLQAINTGSGDATGALVIDAMGTGFDFGSITTTPDATQVAIDNDGKFAYDDNGTQRVFQVDEQGTVSVVDDSDYKAISKKQAERFAYIWSVDVAAGATTEVNLTATIKSGAPDEIVNSGASLNVGSAKQDMSNDTAKVDNVKETGKIEAPKTGQSLAVWLLVACGIAACAVAGRGFVRARRDV